MEVFWDNKGRFVSYVYCYSKEQAKETLKELVRQGFPVWTMTKNKGKVIKQWDVPDVWIIYLSETRVLLKLHQRWYEKGKVIWRRK
jgi:hypothetical protein